GPTPGEEIECADRGAVLPFCPDGCSFDLLVPPVPSTRVDRPNLEFITRRCSAALQGGMFRKNAGLKPGAALRAGGLARHVPNECRAEARGCAPRRRPRAACSKRMPG